jgi:integrase
MVFLNMKACELPIETLGPAITHVLNHEPDSGFELRPVISFNPEDRDIDGKPKPIVTMGKSYLQHTIEKDGIIRGPRDVNWSPLALWIADQTKHGVTPVRLPPIDVLVATVCQGDKIEYRFRYLSQILQQQGNLWPTRVEELDYLVSFKLLQTLVSVYPSVPWAMHEHHIQIMIQVQEYEARQALSMIRELSPEHPVGIKLEQDTTQTVKGTFHEAVRKYMVHRREDFIIGDKINGSGHHMLGLVENFEKRQPDVALAKLDYAGCQEVYDFWRNRPLNFRNGEPLSAKHCSSHVGELDRFFKWLHTSPEFDWKRPSDFDLINRKIKRLDSDRRSLQSIELKTFNIEHLALLYKHALPSERLKLVWCLNCAHGAAEIGRVEWSDIYLDQPHPWIKEGLKYTSRPDDSWCGFLRPKTDVIGWWWLWPETVELVKWWRVELQRMLNREIDTTERMLITSTGQPLYRDSSRNGQTSFGNQWARLLDRVEKNEGLQAVPRLPFGKLRDQLSNWLGSDENQAVLASTALAHGIPHKSDKLLFKHYSNRPWAQLFEKQREFRKVLQPMFDECPNPTASLNTQQHSCE